MGSPKEVPVPCISKTATSGSGTCPAFRAARITVCWDGPFGACNTCPTLLHSGMAGRTQPGDASQKADSSANMLRLTQLPTGCNWQQGKIPGAPVGRSWVCTLGGDQRGRHTVRELDRPSWFTAVPSTTRECPRKSASCSSSGVKDSSRCTTHASPRMYPSAELSRVLQRPSCSHQGGVIVVHRHVSAQGGSCC